MTRLRHNQGAEPLYVLGPEGDGLLTMYGAAEPESLPTADRQGPMVRLTVPC